MSYKYSKGAQIIGDLSGSDDTNRDTGIDFEENYIGFEAGGSAVMVVSGSKVGIGTTTPDYELHVAGNIGIDQFVYHNGDADTLMKFDDNTIVLKAGGKSFIKAEKKGSTPHEVTINDGSNNIDFAVRGNGSNQGNPGMFFDASTNRVGINGVGSPSWELDVAGDIGLAEYIYHRTDTDTYIRFQDNDVRIATAGSERLTVEQNGKVGIGTTSPIAELDVAGKIAITAEMSTPSQPADGKGYLYTKSDGKLYWRSYDISETDLTATSGGGGGGGVTIPYPRLYFSGISPVSQIGNNSFTNATITTDNGKYENGFIDFGSSGNTAPARFETAIPLLGGIYTFSFWFYSKRTGSDYGAILRQESGGTPANTENYPLVTWNTSDELGVFNETSGGTFYGSGYDMTTHEGSNTWIHMAVVANGTNSKFYINGSLVGTANAVVTTSVKELGSYDGNDTQTFAEGIDDFAHWAEALSDQQISEIYNSSSKLRDIVT